MEATEDVAHCVKYVTLLPPYSQNDDYKVWRKADLETFKDMLFFESPGGELEAMAEVTAYFRIVFFVSLTDLAGGIIH